MSNLAEGIFEKGVRDGMNQALNNWRKEVALRMLKDGLPFEKIEKYTKQPLKVIENMAKRNKLMDIYKDVIMSDEQTANAFAWCIRANDASEEKLFLDKNIIAIGWPEVGDLNKIKATRENFKKKTQRAYPNSKNRTVAAWAGTLYRFVVEMQIGDYVIFPSTKTDRMINIGIVKSDYIYNNLSEYPNFRKAKWLKHLPRTYFSQGALSVAGSRMTLFRIKKYADEYLNSL